MLVDAEEIIAAIATVKEAKTFGNVSLGNTKMPGTTFAVDAFACITGSKLAKIKGTPCNSCYARKLQKIRPSVDQGWKANLQKWKDSDPKMWEASMIFQILRYNVDNYHRWFDSGDLQSVGMLESMVNIANAMPQINFWLPTQERQIVAEFKQNGGTIPENLVVRVSASKIDAQEAPNAEHSSTVSKSLKPLGKECNAYRTDKTDKVWTKSAFASLKREEKKELNFGHCGTCRACWNGKIKTVTYPIH